jgi:hypothetical protein
MERIEISQNVAIWTILGSNRDTTWMAMSYLLAFSTLAIPTMKDRTRIDQIRAYFRISTDTLHPLHNEIRRKRQNPLRGKSWMGLTEDIIQQVYPVDDIDTGTEWLMGIDECIKTA